ncbi:STE3-domain-containing protein, partial [Aureobasidium melanogenum]
MQLLILSLLTLLLNPTTSSPLTPRQATNGPHPPTILWSCTGNTDSTLDIPSVCSNMCYGVYCRGYGTRLMFDPFATSLPDDAIAVRKANAGCYSGVSGQPEIGQDRCEDQGMACNVYPYISAVDFAVDVKHGGPVSRCVAKGEDARQSAMLNLFYTSTGPWSNSQGLNSTDFPVFYQQIFANAGELQYCSGLPSDCVTDGAEFDRNGVIFTVSSLRKTSFQPLLGVLLGVSTAMATQGENYLIVEDHIIPQGILLAVLAPLFLILNFPPLIWHLRNRNTAAVFMVFWIMLMNFISIINVIIWPYIDMRHMYDGQGLCDVEVKLLGGRITGLNAAVLCLLRALAAVLNTDKTLLGPSKAQKRRNTAIELAWCVGLPLLTMVLQYIVQLNRFGLIGVSGCQLMAYSSRISFVLIWLPPIITNAVAVYYATLVIIRLHKYRSSFNTILSSSNTTRSRFFRLFAISSILILGITPVQIYIIVTQYPHQNLPFSFSKLHNPATTQASCSRASISHADDTALPSSPTRPLTAFLRRFDPRRRLEQPATNYNLPVFSHRRQISEEDDRGVLVSKEVKRESTIA